MRLNPGIMSLFAYAKFALFIFITSCLRMTTSQVCGKSIVTPSPGLMMGMERLGAFQGEFPWMVSVNVRGKKSDNVHHCSGFLIDATHVLTAAHCFQDESDPGMYVAKIGDISQSATETYAIERIVLHEEYKVGLFYNDIAVMTLSTPVLKGSFNPVCLPTDDIMRMNLSGMRSTLVGWGPERYRGALSDLLKKPKVIPIVSNEECNRIYSSELKKVFHRVFPDGINNKFLCAGYLDRPLHTCLFTSGSPLLYKRNEIYYAVGIVSFGIGCKESVPGGFTNISAHMDWIRRHTRD